MALVTLVGSVSESQNHKLILVIHYTIRLLPKSQNHKRLRWGLWVSVVSFYTTEMWESQGIF
jgi:hypothetical protein